MNPFVQKIINERKIRFNEGIFSVYHIPYIILPMNTFILFQKILEKEYGSETGEFIYQIAKRQGRTAVELQLKLSGYAKNLNTLRYQLQQCELMGLGNLEVARFDPKNKHVIIKNSNSPFCSQVVKLFGFQKEAVNHFLRGWCVGVVGGILDADNLKAVETQCVSQGKPYCLFEIKEEIKWDANDKCFAEQAHKLKIDSELLNQKMGLNSFLDSKIKIDSLKSPKQLIEKIIRGKELVFDGGEFKIWGMYAVMFPINTFVFLYKALRDKYGKGINDILYSLGKIQVENAIQVLIQRFGLQKMEDVITSVVQQSELAGLGNSELVKIDFKEKSMIIKNLNSPFCIEYKKLFGSSKEPVNYYLVGAAAGFGKGLFKEEMIAIEKECIAQGNSFCIVEATETDKLDLKEENTKKEFPKNIIDNSTFGQYMNPIALMAPEKS